jgi:hypothetical protein
MKARYDVDEISRIRPEASLGDYMVTRKTCRLDLDTDSIHSTGPGEGVVGFDFPLVDAANMIAE